MKFPIFFICQMKICSKIIGMFFFQYYDGDAVVVFFAQSLSLLYDRKIVCLNSGLYVCRWKEGGWVGPGAWEIYVWLLVAKKSFCKVEKLNFGCYMQTFCLLALAFSQLLVFVLIFNMRKLTFLHENCCPLQRPQATEYIYVYIDSHSTSGIYYCVLNYIEPFCFYSAKNDTLT